MKRKLLGVKRQDIQLDYDLYRRRVPLRDVGGAALSVLDLWPAGATQTVMFVHGYAGVLESWEFQINHFIRAGYRVVAPDLRGHGQSDAPYTQYTMPELVSDLQTIVETLDFPEKFTLVAHSFGGSIAVEYANAHPERLENLVLIATAGEFPLPAIAKWVMRIPARLIKPLWRYRRKWDAEYHVVKRMMANNMMKWQGWTLLRNIRTNTLIITGERDNYFPRWVFEDVGNTVPDAEVVDVGSAKHKVQLERHQAVNRTIERFIAGEKQRSWRSRAVGDATLADRIWLKAYDKQTPVSVPVPKRPLHHFLESAAHWVPKRKATVFYGTALTYAQLDAQVNQFAHVLHGLGVRPGDRVMVVLPNVPQMVIAYYAVLKVGGVVVLPNPDADVKRVAAEIEATQPNVLVTLTSFALLAKAIKKLTGIEHILFADIRTMITPRAYRKLIERWGISENEARDKALAKQLGKRMASLMRDAPETPLEIDVDHESLATIIFTSGTTNAPKGVCLTHANLVANTLQTRHWIPNVAYGKEVALAVVPLLHSYGMTNAMNIPIALGGTIILMPVFDVTDVLHHIREYSVSIMPGVPSMYAALNQAPNVRDYGLSSINACISGAAPLPVEVQEAFEKLTRGRLVEGYGLTEASPVTHANPIMGQSKQGSIGLPVPNTEARIVDLVTGDVVPAGTIGELQVRGPQVMRGYWQADGSIDPGDAITPDGWLITGDVAVVDGDGYFTIVNRKQDTIIFGEYNVYPRDVEEVIYENNKVLEVAVVGIGTADGQRVKAYVVPRPGMQISEAELLDLCRRRLEPYAVPWEIEFRESLPKSFVGKVLRRLLTESLTDKPVRSD